MARYTATHFDLCAPGFERLRSTDEFIVLAYPDNRTGWRALRDAWLSDLQSCDRGAGFDFDAARAAIRAYARELQRELGGRSLARRYGITLQGAAARPYSVNTLEDGAPVAFLYIRDNKSE